MSDWVFGIVEALGPLGVGLLILLENLFPPIPSELILPLAGYLTGTGRLSFPATVAAATVGSVLGALVLYGIGAQLGRERVRRLIDRMPLVDVADLERAEGWFERHGTAAVLLGRMVPVVRSLISVPAGIQRMSVPRFVLLTAIGSLAWNTLFIGLGAVVGSRWEDVTWVADLISYGVLAVLAGSIALFVAKRLRARRRAAS